MQTKILKIDSENLNIGYIKQAAEILQRGGIIAFPTETVYGLGADYDNNKAVNRLYEIKRRPKTKPFTIQISSKQQVYKYIDLKKIDKKIELLMDEFWPGPLTIILQSENNKLGFRVPACRVALELIKTSKLAIAAPSANISGAPDLFDADSVYNTFKGVIDLIIDAGPSSLKIASTVVDATVWPACVIREGAESEKIKAFLQ